MLVPSFSSFTARVLGAILSWISLANLRNEMYRLRDRNETLEIALDDISRIDPEGLAGNVARRALKRVRSIL